MNRVMDHPRDLVDLGLAGEAGKHGRGSNGPTPYPNETEVSDVNLVRQKRVLDSGSFPGRPAFWMCPEFRRDGGGLHGGEYVAGGR